MNVWCGSTYSVSPLQCTLLACDCEQSATTAPPHHHITMGIFTCCREISIILHTFRIYYVVSCNLCRCHAATNYNYAKANRNTYNPSQKERLNLFLQPRSPSSHRIRPPSRPATAGTPCCSRTPACRASHSPGCASHTSTGGRTVT